MHVHCLGSLLFDCFIDEALGSGVVDLRMGWWFVTEDAMQRIL